MEPQSIRYKNYDIALGSHPTEADLAVTSIDSAGNIGVLNKFVLDRYGYKSSILNYLDLSEGYCYYKGKEKDIIFVVTVPSFATDTNMLLRSNLYEAIQKNFSKIRGKTIWIPLLGTGSAELPYETSLSSIIFTINRVFQFLEESTRFIISIPEDEQGKKLYQLVIEDVKKANPNSSQFIETARSETKNFSSTTGNKIQEEVIRQIKKRSIKIYYAPSEFNGTSYASAFYDDFIWENFDDTNVGPGIRDVQQDDMLLLFSTQTNQSQKQTIICGVGRVLANPNDGFSLGVHWMIRDINEIIPATANRDSKISKVQSSEIKSILSNFNNKVLLKLRDHLSTWSLNIIKKPISDAPKGLQLTQSKANAKRKVPAENPKSGTKTDTNTPNVTYTTLPGIQNDGELGEDYLDISKDTSAFARVMAARSFYPPLAIALLGKWGSGKSFFMQKLKGNIEKLSRDNPQNAFCKGIVHIHFNAWSYMDANLWASFVTRIFEGLEEYIKGSNVAANEKKNIEKQLFEKLTISKEELQILQNQKEKVESHISNLESEKVSIQEELRSNISSIEETSLIKILEQADEEFQPAQKIEDALKKNPTFVASVAEFESIVPREYWKNPIKFYRQLKSAYTFLKAFFHRDKIWKNIAWSAGIITLLLFIQFGLVELVVYLGWQNFTISKANWISICLAGTAFVRGVDTFVKLRKQITPFWKIKEDYQAKKEDAIFQFGQREKALQLEISNAKEQIIAIDKQILISKEHKATLEFKLKNALSTEALYSFIERRAGSEDYKKHLGIVSLIRKDFEILSGLLTDHQTDLVTSKESQEFKDLFKNPLERIILYIDDLDRCPEERVVEVLEAVNLLMAFPLFVVVVGVDPRWVKNALIKKHRMQFTGKIGKEDDKRIEVIEASSYLEKIFQVPFYLKDASDTSIKSMVEKLARRRPVIEEVEQPEASSVESNVGNVGNAISVGPVVPIVISKRPDEGAAVESFPSAELTSIERINALDITDNEIKQIQELTPMIGNNPRLVKRFINVYRIIKTHEDFEVNEESKEQELLSIMFLLALSFGVYKDLMPSFDGQVNSIIVHEYPIKSFMNPQPSTDSDASARRIRLKELKNLLPENSALFETEASMVKKHCNFIKRFTFKNI
jgi:hypothetical protein